MINIKIKRLMAATIDFTMNIILAVLVVNIITLGNFNLSATTTLKIFASIIYILLFLTYTLVKDWLFKNVSLGKKIFQIVIVNTQGNEVKDKKLLLSRNLKTLLLFPIYPIMILAINKSSGDYKYGTYVANKKEIQKSHIT